jgi:Protein of unknown function (DUF3662)/FHA domain
VGILDRFEKGLERAVNGAFAKTFRSGLQPVEISAALKRELDTRAVIVTRDRVLAPNVFTVRLSPSDSERMSTIGQTLVDELVEVVRVHAVERHYQFAGGIEVELSSDGRLAAGVVEVDSRNVKGSISWTPVLEVEGRRHVIRSSRTVIGRGAEADVTIDDAGASRHHAEVLWDGRTAKVRDLGSTNGTKVDGRTVPEAILEPDGVIVIGETRIVFRVLPTARPGVAGDDAISDHPSDKGFWDR